MVEVRWTNQACQDLQAIVDFIEKDSSQYARLFVVNIFQAVGRIVRFPKSAAWSPNLERQRGRPSERFGKRGKAAAAAQ